MKLLRYGPAGAEKPGILGADGTVRDLSRVLGDIDGKALAPDSLARLKKLNPSDLPAVSGKPRLGPPLTGIGKIVAIGLNYSDHAAETGAVAGDHQAAQRVAVRLAVVATLELLQDSLDDRLLGARRALDGVQPAQQLEQRHQPRCARLTAVRAWPAPTRSGAIASACW